VLDMMTAHLLAAEMVVDGMCERASDPGRAKALSVERIRLTDADGRVEGPALNQVDRVL